MTSYRKPCRCFSCRINAEITERQRFPWIAAALLLSLALVYWEVTRL